jgi:hypothetical protein
MRSVASDSTGDVRSEQKILAGAYRAGLHRMAIHLGGPPQPVFTREDMTRLREET